jgi:outer membrane receptor protein involved in Fe transport
LISTSLPQFNAVNSYSVQEDTTAAYTELAFAGGNWSGNTGLRLVHTCQCVHCGQQHPYPSRSPTPPIRPTRRSCTARQTPTSSSNDYTEVLPSLNLLYRFAPQLQLRIEPRKR